MENYTSLTLPRQERHSSLVLQEKCNSALHFSDLFTQTVCFHLFRGKKKKKSLPLEHV